MLQLAGAYPLPTSPQPGQPGQALSWAALRQMAPDILILSCPQPEAAAGLPLEQLSGDPTGWP